MEERALIDPPRWMNDISRDVVAAAMKVHTALGPGLLESAYEACLAHELCRRERTVDALFGRVSAGLQSRTLAPNAAEIWPAHFERIVGILNARPADE